MVQKHKKEKCFQTGFITMIATEDHSLSRYKKRGRHEKKKVKKKKNSEREQQNDEQKQSLEDEGQGTDQCGGDELRIGGESGSTWCRSMSLGIMGRWRLSRTMVDSVVRLSSHDQDGQDNADEGKADQRTSCCHFDSSPSSYSVSFFCFSL